MIQKGQQERIDNPYSPCAHKESGQRGHVKYEIVFYKLAFSTLPHFNVQYWWADSDANRRTDNRKKRSLRKAKRQLEPIIKMWAESEFKYIMDVNDFVLKTLGIK